MKLLSNRHLIGKQKTIIKIARVCVSKNYNSSQHPPSKLRRGKRGEMPSWGNAPKDSSEVDLQLLVSYTAWCVCASQSFIIIISSSQIFSSQLPDNVLVEMLFSLVLMLVMVK